MSKADTIDALMDSAIHVFSRYGFEGAALRDIARDAGVPLSTIHHYFGSKADLFAAVGRQAWDEIDRERSLLLEQAVAEAPGHDRIEKLVHALAYPIARRACSDSDRDKAQIALLRGYLGYAHHDFVSRLVKVADRSMVRWIDAMVPSCAALSRDDVIWAFSFVVGAVYSWQLIDHRYDTMLNVVAERSAHEVTSDIVAFCCKGIEAICERRAAQRATDEPPLRIAVSA